MFIGLIQRKNARIAASGSLWYKLPEYNVKNGLGPVKYRFLLIFISILGKGYQIAREIMKPSGNESFFYGGKEYDVGFCLNLEKAYKTQSFRAQTIANNSNK